MSPETINRFWSHVKKTEGCWLWTAHKSRGYGQFKHNKRTLGAHRVALEIARGEPLPPNVFACHSCDNPACVNPAHLFAASHAENMRDMSLKGRSVHGSKHKGARLSEDDVRAICLRLLMGEFQIQVAEAFGVTQSAIAHITTGRSWRHVTGLVGPK